MAERNLFNGHSIAHELPYSGGDCKKVFGRDLGWRRLVARKRALAHVYFDFLQEKPVVLTGSRDYSLTRMALHLLNSCPIVMKFMFVNSAQYNKVSPHRKFLVHEIHIDV